MALQKGLYLYVAIPCCVSPFMSTEGSWAPVGHNLGQGYCQRVKALHYLLVSCAVLVGPDNKGETF